MTSERSQAKATSPDGEATEPEALDQGSIDAFLGIDNASRAEPRSAIQILVDSQTETSPSIPMMDAIFDRLLGLLKASIRKFGTDLIEIRLSASSTVRFGAYIQSIPLPSIQAIIKAQDSNAPALIVFEGNLVSTLMDVVFGGNAHFRPPLVEGRAFSTVELRTIRRLIELIVSDINDTFAPIKETNFSFDHIETNPRFATIAQPQSVAAIGTFSIEVGSLSGSFQIVIPDGTLDPLRSQLAESFSGSNANQDLGWSAALARSVSQANVTLEAVLYEKQMPLRNVMAFAVGDTLMLDVAPDHLIELKCEGVALSRGRMGRLDERVAVSIVENVARTAHEPAGPVV